MSIIRDVVMRVSDKTNVSDSYGRKSTTVCDAVVEYDNGMAVTFAIRATLATDKDTKEESITIAPNVRIKSYGQDIVRFANEAEADEFAAFLMENAIVWNVFESVQNKAIERLTGPKVAAKSVAGRLIYKVPAKSEPAPTHDANNLALPTSEVGKS